MKNILIILLLGCSLSGFSFQQDSINTELSNRLKIVEGHQNNVDGAIDNKFNALSHRLEENYQLFKWFGYIGIPLNALFILGLLWGGKKYVNQKINREINKTVVENKQAIKEAIEKEHTEITLVKTKKILVLTKEKDNEKFLRKFFKTMKFPKDNIVFDLAKNIIPNDQNAYVKNFDMIFANNENSDLDIDIIHSYFKTSDPKSVLFYFGSKRFEAENDQTKDRLSFATARTQIYGNLINLFKYQKLLK